MPTDEDRPLHAARSEKDQAPLCGAPYEGLPTGTYLVERINCTRCAEMVVNDLQKTPRELDHICTEEEAARALNRSNARRCLECHEPIQPKPFNEATAQTYEYDDAMAYEAGYCHPVCHRQGTIKLVRQRACWWQAVRS